MSPDLYRQIEEVYHTALQLEPERRPQFLAEMCGDDHQLRAEVESLLDHREQAGEFLNLPAIKIAAAVIADQGPTFNQGDRFGHYEILSLLGQGGMGQVFLAQDHSLDRRVALKILPPGLNADPEHVRRFEQEAHAASALNHPNIMTVHEIGNFDGVLIIVTEFIDGETLRERIQRSPIPWRETVEIARQMTGALAAAHAAKILHRDIKPENVIIRPDGYVKVLDFGLAKVGEKQTGKPELEASQTAGGSPHSNLTGVETDTGMLMGTTSYMSPEQALGSKIDHRTDLFSLGVVLYEMIAGRRPFTGATRAEMFKAITEAEPPPLEIPGEVRQIISRALKKDRAHRYQSAIELLADLTALSYQAALPPTSINNSPARPRARRRLSILSACLLIALTAIAGWGAFKLSKNSRPLKATPRVSRVIATGQVQHVAISPDGRSLAHTEGSDIQQSLWLRDIARSKDQQLVPSEGLNSHRGLTFSPDGNSIYFVLYQADRDLNSLYAISIRGGEARKILDHVDAPVSFSPDGKQFAFVRHDLTRRMSELMTASLTGGEIKKLAARAAPERIQSPPAWSPDGEVIAFSAGTVATGLNQQIFGVSPNGGVERVLSARKMSEFTSLVWAGDRLTLLLQAIPEPGDPHQIYILNLSSGETRLVTDNLDNYWGVSAAADLSALVTIQSVQLASIWLVPKADSARATQLRIGKSEGSEGLSWAPDRRIIYSSEISGALEIWSMDAGGNDRRQLTSGSLEDHAPEMSADGRHIVYSSRKSAGSAVHVWRMNSDGSNRLQLTNGIGEYEPRFSPDGRWVFYTHWSPNRRSSVWKVLIDGGQPTQITPEGTANPSGAISTDGRLLASYYRDVGVEKKKIVITLFHGDHTGELIKSFDIPHTAYLLKWTRDGRGINFATTLEGVGNIWRLSYKTGAATQITHFKSDLIRNFDWSPDGVDLICSRSIRHRDALLIRDFK